LLPQDGGEAHGYEEFFASIDTIVVGRNTFELVRGFSEWPYKGKRVVVLSSRAIDTNGLDVEWMSGAPEEIAKRLEAAGAKHVYVDGGITIQRFLSAGLITDLTVTHVPVLIGEGIPLFGQIPHDIQLRHLSTRAFASGLVQSIYEVVR